MRFLRKIFLILFFSFYLSCPLISRSWALETVSDINDVSVLEEQAEKQLRPYSLGPKEYHPSICRLFSWLPVPWLPLLSALCVDAEQVHQDINPKEAQVKLTPPPEEVGTQSANLEGQFQAQASTSLDWLLGTIFNFIGGPKGHAKTSSPFKRRPGNLKAMQDSGQEQDIVRVTKDLWDTVNPYKLAKETKYTPPPDELPTELPIFAPGEPGETAKTLNDLFSRAGDWAKVPWQIIQAMAIIEGSGYRVGDDLNNINSGIFAFTPEQIVAYQEPGAKAPIYCNPNACSAAGVMQMTTTGCVPFDTCLEKRDDTTNVDCSLCAKACQYKPSAWSVYKGAVLEADDDGRTPNICNLKDSVYAAAKKMKIDSGTEIGVLEDWDQRTVYQVAERYYGACVPCDVATPGSGAAYACKRLGMTYCEFVWQYYQSYNK